MAYFRVFIKSICIAFALVSNAISQIEPCQTLSCDTLAVKEILALNGISNPGLNGVTIDTLTNRVIRFGYGFDTIPPQIGRLSELKHLSIYGNQSNILDLTSLPTEMSLLSKLELLEIKFVNWTIPPKEIGLIPNLKHLLVTSCSLVDLPDELTNLPLEFLDISYNNFENLPDVIFEISTLRKFGSRINPIENIPPEIVQLTELCSLYVTNSSIVKLPENIGDLKNLKYLEVSGSKLTVLPVSIGDLDSLQELLVFDNELKSLPPEIGNLQNLKKLSIHENYFEELPAEIGNLSKLETLNVRNNLLTDLPSEIATLSNLDRLHLQTNNISYLREELFTLEKLTILDLSHNQLTEIPPSISKLNNLTHLYLAFNGLSDLPLELTNMPNLYAMDLAFNNFCNLPDTLIEWLSTQTAYLGNPNTYEYIMETQRLDSVTYCDGSEINVKTAFPLSRSKIYQYQLNSDFYIIFESSSSKNVEIYNLEGRIAATFYDVKGRLRISKGSMPNSIYFVRVFDGDETYTTKILFGK